MTTTINNLSITNAASAAAVSGVESRKAHRGVDPTLHRVSELQDVIDTLDGDLYMLIYDIPDLLKDEAPNPSRDFWNHGFRLNLSCWVMPEKGLKSACVQSYLEHWASLPQVRQRVNPNLPYFENRGVKTFTIKYAEDQKAHIREIAKEMLRQELVRVHTALIERIDAADQRLRQAEEVLNSLVGPQAEGAMEKEQAKVANAHAGSMRATLRDAIEAFEGALKSARMFDDTDSLADLFAGVRGAIRASALAFNARMEFLGRRQVALPLAVSTGDVLAVEADATEAA